MTFNYILISLCFANYFKLIKTTKLQSDYGNESFYRFPKITKKFTHKSPGMLINILDFYQIYVYIIYSAAQKLNPVSGALSRRTMQRSLRVESHLFIFFYFKRQSWRKKWSLSHSNVINYKVSKSSAC